MTSPARTSIVSDATLWDAYNLLLLGPDLGRIRKMLVRYRLFEQTLEVPGDVVECGVFRGAGVAYWAKLLEIFSPNSTKKVVGFDSFRPFIEVSLRPDEREIAQRHDEIIPGTGKAEIADLIEAAGLTQRAELVEGGIEMTAPMWAQKNSGRRISLLHLDLDTYSGTKAALAALYPLVSRGGLVVFDEYGDQEVGESDAVDEFFAGTELKPLAVPYAESPTAYLVKP